MTTLVTGATGALGRMLSAALRGDGAGEVLGVAHRSPVEPGLVECDLTDASAVRALIRRTRPARIFHLAGSFSSDYETDYAVNALGAKHLLDALAGEALRSRVVVMGSAAEYGLLDPDENPVSERQVLRPVSTYGLTKAFQTQIACHHACAHGSDVVVARMFNLMASGLSERLFVGRVERMIERYLRGEAAAIEVGNLDGRRDYVTAPEAIAQIRDIAAKGARGEVYHVASGTAVAMREVLRGMLESARIPGAVVREAVPGSGGRTGYDVPVIYADMRRTRAL